MKVTLKIIITKEYLLQIKLIHSDETETIIKLSQNDPDFYVPCIEFNKNFVSVCTDNNKAIHFIKNFINNPDDFTPIEINYQYKQYHILPEMLFVILINNFGDDL